MSTVAPETTAPKARPPAGPGFVTAPLTDAAMRAAGSMVGSRCERPVLMHLTWRRVEAS